MAFVTSHYANAINSFYATKKKKEGLKVFNQDREKKRWISIIDTNTQRIEDVVILRIFLTLCVLPCAVKPPNIRDQKESIDRSSNDKSMNLC